ncbi:MAG: hypothetical protein EWV50_16095 [Microcystis aeruginosa Ma_MB_F_20061100_S20]|uniref:Uncharacterized protein n=1 Tax=Microcystis aeruginosa Ma_MB_F_20061100_S20D TaxID=2486253 RepID=A0A552EWS2_MICAE|nr:MAG: hypothetical protein EWV50_16095 [Microcystis aeruginosa Ma_MB_F_20061100_S20]TRU38923.1 MAG: hypothetical protein EWV78_04010 [Microcystis aeruginosa Ma_MB_F_20061100_S20D]
MCFPCFQTFNRDKLPRCHNPGCYAGSHYDGATLTGSLDYRLTAEICRELDAIERKNWRDYRNPPIDYRQKSETVPAHIDRGKVSAAEASGCFGGIERSLLISAVTVPA